MKQHSEKLETLQNKYQTFVLIFEVPGAIAGGIDKDGSTGNVIVEQIFLHRAIKYLLDQNLTILDVRRGKAAPNDRMILFQIKETP